MNYLLPIEQKLNDKIQIEYLLLILLIESDLRIYFFFFLLKYKKYKITRRNESLGIFFSNQIFVKSSRMKFGFIFRYQRRIGVYGGAGVTVE